MVLTLWHLVHCDGFCEDLHGVQCKGCLCDLAALPQSLQIFETSAYRPWCAGMCGVSLASASSMRQFRAYNPTASGTNLAKSSLRAGLPFSPTKPSGAERYSENCRFN